MMVWLARRVCVLVAAACLAAPTDVAWAQPPSDDAAPKAPQPFPTPKEAGDAKPAEPKPAEPKPSEGEPSEDDAAEAKPSPDAAEAKPAIPAEVAEPTDEPAEAPAAPAQRRSPIDFGDVPSLLRQIGVIGIFLGICSLVMVWFGLERYLRLRRPRVVPRSFRRRFLNRLYDRELDRLRALELCRADGSPLSEVVEAAVRHWGKPLGEIEQAVSEAGQVQVARLKRNLRTLRTTASVATLLGLLGTVIGMIQAFNQVATAGSGRAEVLASGIAQALLTTAAGLVIAIPSLVLYGWFAGMIEQHVLTMNEVAREVIDEICLESQGGATASPVAPAPAGGPAAPAPAEPPVAAAPTGRPDGALGPSIRRLS